MSTLAPKVLVVDDDASALQALGELLQYEGFEVATAPDARQALALVGTFHPSVVLVDLRMPCVSGIELMRSIRELKRSIAVILMTVANTVALEALVESLGGVGILQKPLNVERVAGAIRKAVSVPLAH